MGLHLVIHKLGVSKFCVCFSGFKEKFLMALSGFYFESYALKATDLGCLFYLKPCCFLYYFLVGLICFLLLI